MPVRLLAGGHLAGDLQSAGAALFIGLQAGLHDARGRGILAQGPADAPAHRFPVRLRLALQPGVDPAQGLGQPVALTLEHRALLFRPGRIAAQHVFFPGLPVGMGDQTHFQSVLHLLPVGLIKQGRLVVAFGVPTR